MRGWTMWITHKTKSEAFKIKNLLARKGALPYNSSQVRKYLEGNIKHTERVMPQE